jgi:hypothetical protein
LVLPVVLGLLWVRVSGHWLLTVLRQTAWMVLRDGLQDWLLILHIAQDALDHECGD